MRILLFLLALAAATFAASKPNIVVILTDDMGYSDIGCYGGEIATPNLDQLASEGVRFTQFYNTGRCCPTRAALLTGLYSHQAGVGHMVEDHSAIAGPAYAGNLSPKAATIAENLKPAGYRTYAVGKWHVTNHTAPEGPKDNWPLQRGFDRYYGTVLGGGNYWDPGSLTRDNTQISPFTDPEYQPAEPYYYTDAISEHAVRFIADHHRDHADAPFFLYVVYTAAHWPMQARESDIAKYHGRYDGGYEAIRAARYAKQKELGLIDSGWPLSPAPGAWERQPNHAWEARCMEVYAAMVDRMDQGVGRIVSTLKETGQIENTLVLYLQDNGGCAEKIGRGGKAQRQDKPTLPAIPKDAVVGQITRKQTREGFPLLGGPGVMPGPIDTFISYGENWANVSNTPFREYKHWVHEGGISTPLIAHWPAGIAAERAGKFERQPAHLIDIMATALDLAGAQPLADRMPPEGVSLRAAFNGKPLDRSAPIFFEHEGNRAVRDGKWKLVAKNKKPWELYDTEADRTELNDLAGSQPERVRTMSSQYEAWAQRVGAKPFPLQKKGAGKAKKKAAE